ncbi:MAG: zinc ribbon domain-containing protein [Pseudobutyrivibrio sp.]|nr:zinc ribbon domain-containing protein [Pseudobutyrivibrio sp.]
MFCVGCGKEIEDGLKFCPYCGKTQIDENEEKKAFGEEPEAKINLDNLTGAFSELKVGEPDVIASDDEVFVDSDEVKVESLGNGWIKNLVLSHGLNKNAMILTNKRLYFQGKAFKKGRFIKNEQIVNVEDVTGVSAEYHNPIVSLIVCGLLLIINFLYLQRLEFYLLMDLLGKTTTFSEVIMIALQLLLIAVFIFLLLTRKAYLKIDYAGGYILFELKNSNRHRAPGFIKALNKVKDKRKAELSGK